MKTLKKILIDNIEKELNLIKIEYEIKEKENGNINVLLYYPEVNLNLNLTKNDKIIKNVYKIIDLFILIEFNLKNPNIFISGTRTTFKKKELAVGFIHPHLPKFSNLNTYNSSNSPNNLNYFCLGNSDLRDDIYKLTKIITSYFEDALVNTYLIELKFLLKKFFYDVNSLAHTESVSGIPYISYTQVLSNNLISINDFSFVLNKSNSLSILIEEILNYIINNNLIDKVIIKDGFIYDIKLNLTKKDVDNILNKVDLSIYNTILLNNIIVFNIDEDYDNTYIYNGRDNYNLSIITKNLKNGLYYINFKDKIYEFKIIEDVDEKENHLIEYNLHPKLKQIIINTINNNLKEQMLKNQLKN